jgi:hypothetical protein
MDRRLAKLEEMLAAISELHTSYGWSEEFCQECDPMLDWPCRTRRILDGICGDNP